jgi:uncharacterized membrane protein YccC
MKERKIRHQFLLGADLSGRLEKLSRVPGTTKSKVIAKAVEAFLDRQAENEMDQRYGKRLDRMSHDIEHLRRDSEVLLESLALFIRFSITLNAHTPMPDKATQALAHERFLKFVDQVGHKIASGKSASLTNNGTETS